MPADRYFAPADLRRHGTGDLKMLRLVILFAVLCSTGAAAETARVATWNLGGFHPIPQSRLDRIIDGLEELDADIVVLPELNPISHAQTIAAELSEPADQCYRSLTPDQPRASQEIAFLFKCSVEVSDPGLIAGSDLGRRGYRNASVVNARAGQFDFVLIGLHLKASRGQANRALRNAQLGFINGFIQGVLRSGEKDVIVIGDYNMIPGQDDENFSVLNEGGFLRFVSSEDLAGSFTHVRRNGSPGNLLDGYAFTIVDFSEYQNDSIEIIPMHQRLGLSLQDYAAQVTDHLPVVAVFNIDTDHD